MVAMTGIKLKVLKRSGTLYDLNGSHSPPASTPPLNGVIRGQPVNIATFGIKSKVLVRTLRKYDFTVVLKKKKKKKKNSGTLHCFNGSHSSPGSSHMLF